MKPELIIFDCDGVLVDSEIVAARIEAEMISAAGIPVSAEEIMERYAGLTFRDMLLRIEAETQTPLQASLIDRVEAEVDRRLKSGVQAIEGARAAVAAVTERKCVCSNSQGDRLSAMLERTGIAPLFGPNIFSARDIPSRRPKPAPDVFLYAAGTMKVDPASVFVVEDSVHGIHGARTAGMRVIGFTGGSHTYPGHADKLTEAGAETVISRWSDFRGVVAALSEWSEAI